MASTYDGSVEGAREVIKALMKTHGVSQKEMAARLNVSPAAVSQTLAGSYVMSASNAARYFTALDFDAEIVPPKLTVRPGKLVPQEGVRKRGRRK